MKNLSNGEYVLREGQRSSQCAIVISGFLFRQKVVGSRNQILSIYVPGDMPDVSTLHLPLSDHDLLSSGRSIIALVSHTSLNDLLISSPTLTHAFWRDTLVDAAIYREWVANVGLRDALARVAHLFCEPATRLEVVGLFEDDEFAFPFTQANLADATGVSVVHLNPTVQHLRRGKLIEWKNQYVRLLRRKELAEIADFMPENLHLSDRDWRGGASNVAS